MSAASEAVHDDMIWSRLPQPLRLLGSPRPPRPPRLLWTRPPCGQRLAATNEKIGGCQIVARELILHIVCQAQDAGHDLIGIQEVVRVEGVNDALICLAERTGARNALQHEETKVVRAGGH
jgi:hypothetical protein